MIQVKNFNKVSQFSKLIFRFEVWIYLVSHDIQKVHDEFKVNECVRLSKFEQQYVSNYHNIWKRTQIPVVRWKNILLLHSSFLLIHSMIAAPFLKSQAITLRLLRFFSKYFLHCQYNRYIGVAIYTNSLILIWYICWKYLSHRKYHPPYDPKAGQKALIQIINKPDNFHSYETVSKVETA